jgi:glucose-6-phosphate-specific signal transduction histidine kinase
MCEWFTTMQLMAGGARADLGGDVEVVRPDAERGGYGLRGMRERVALHGGSLDAGALDGGGFLVAATLPLAPAHERDRGEVQHA